MGVAEDLIFIKKCVEAIEQESVLLCSVHASWKPTVFDDDLFSRMGYSYSGHTFQVIRFALRREMLMGLARMWDQTERTTGLSQLARRIKKESVFQTVVDEFCLARYGERERGRGLAYESLDKKRQDVLKVVALYEQGGPKCTVKKRILSVRNQELAHRQVDDGNRVAIFWDDSEIEQLYLDTLYIAETLLELVLLRGFDLSGVASVYAHHARHFWDGVRGDGGGEAKTA